MRKTAGEPQQASPTVAVHFLRLLTDFATRHGLSEESLLLQARIAPQALGNPNGRVPFANFSRLCEVAAEALDEPCMGLKLGQSIRPGHLGSYGYALMSCSSALELLQQSIRYSALANNGAHIAIEMRGSHYIRYWRSNLPGQASLGRLQDELNQALWVTLARWFMNRDDMPLAWVSFQHARPADVRAYEALFRCELRFGAKETGLCFSAAYIGLPTPHANPQLRDNMERICADLLRQLGTAQTPPWLAAVRRAVLDAFKLGSPEIGAIARAACLTESQLKAQLAQHGTSFRSVVDELRHALATGYMRDPRLELVDIAYLLGFSEQSAFQRAFKRWTGTTPGEYRRHPPSGLSIGTSAVI